jgi:site-specific DNA-adenine methylase
MRFIGQKQKKYYTEFISKFIPDNINTYIEPFGGSFAVATYIAEDVTKKTKKIIYNDIIRYDMVIYADKVHHLDYKEIFKMYDSEDVVFYLDPPYYGKEFLYDNSDNFNHEELRNEIMNLKGKVVLSYEDCPFIRNLYNGFNINLYDGENFIFRNELIIIN